MDSEMIEKINNFKAAILKDANKKSSEIEAANNKIKEIKVEEARDEFLAEAYENIQEAIADIKKNDNERVLSAQFDAKKELLMKRENIISEVFDNVGKKLNDFIKTVEYKEWMKKKFDKAMDIAGAGDKTIYVSDKDSELIKEIISAVNDNIKIEEVPEKEIIGGLKLENNNENVMIDYSFAELLNNQKADFLQKSGLTIY